MYETLCCRSILIFYRVRIFTSPGVKLEFQRRQLKAVHLYRHRFPKTLSISSRAAASQISPNLLVFQYPTINLFLSALSQPPAFLQQVSLSLNSGYSCEGRSVMQRYGVPCSRTCGYQRRNFYLSKMKQNRVPRGA